MKRMLVVLSTVTLLAAAYSLATAAISPIGPIVVHENWASKKIRGNYWTGIVPFAEADTGLQSGRAVVVSATGVPELWMNTTEQSDETSRFRFAMNILGIPFFYDVSYIETTFRVTSASVKAGCDGAGYAEVGAVVALVPFADGTAKAHPADRTGDLLAVVAAGRSTEMTDSARILHLFAFVARCEDLDCRTFEDIVGTAIGTARRGSRVRASITADPANDKFVVQAGSSAPVDLPYGDGLTPVSETAAGKAIAGIGQIASAGNCPAATAASTAYFGAVKRASAE